MFAVKSLLRKASQVAADPVLRRWLLSRLVRQADGPPQFYAHQPPYLRDFLPLATEEPHPPRPFTTIQSETPRAPLRIELPGKTVTVPVHAPEVLFNTSCHDTETLLAIHRFSWLPLIREAFDPAWVSILWNVWRLRHGRVDDSWAWHPYTAAERAINIIDFGERHGLPAPAESTLELLAAHGPAIASRLEYFGEHHTSNHLANNGRGLYRIGLALGLNACADLGGRILLEEAKRIFQPSGVLREGSTHYHLLLTRNYIDAWLAARAHGRGEESSLRTVAQCALSVAHALRLPGGMPLVGDISPDCPPDYLAGLGSTDLECAWLAGLHADARDAIATLCSDSSANAALSRDGWHRIEHSPWCGLWHVPPEGWSPMPGHAHQDLGAAEIHFQDEPVLIDLGRGAYGDVGNAGLYRSGKIHGTLLLDGEDPYPPTRPYYDPSFRRKVVSQPPCFQSNGRTAVLVHHGFSRLHRVGAVKRKWIFERECVRIEDTVCGSGRHVVERFFPTGLPATTEERTVCLHGRLASYDLSTAESSAVIKPATRWTAYGVGVSASLISVRETVELPWRGEAVLSIR